MQTCRTHVQNAKLLVVLLFDFAQNVQLQSAKRSGCSCFLRLVLTVEPEIRFWKVELLRSLCFSVLHVPPVPVVRLLAKRSFAERKGQFLDSPQEHQRGTLPVHATVWRKPKNTSALRVLSLKSWRARTSCKASERQPPKTRWALSTNLAYLAHHKPVCDNLALKIEIAQTKKS